MDTVELDGVRYVKASVAAKKFRYTQDYIGQLCRGKKIDARLVGRTWFVNTDSLITHKQNKYKTKKVTETTQKVEVSVDLGNERKASEEPIKRPVSVQSVPGGKTIKSVLNIADESKSSEDQRKLRVAYSRDEEAVLPTLKKRVVKPPRTVRVKPANAKAVRVRSKRQKTLYKAGELPEVSLSGALKIEDYPDIPAPEDVVDVTEEGSVNTENKPTNKDISDKRETKLTATELQVKETAGSRAQKVTVKNEPIAFDKKLEVEAERQAKQAIKPVTREKVFIADVKKVPEISSEPAIPSSFHPNVVVSDVQQGRSSFVLVASPLIATVFALVCVLLIFSASAQVVVQDVSSDSKVVLQMANLLEVLTQ